MRVRPSRVAPASIIASACSELSSNPDALIPSLPPTASRKISTARMVAPPAAWRPVEVAT